MVGETSRVHFDATPSRRIFMSHVSTKRPYREFMQHLVGEYRDAGQPWPATAKTIARWMIRHKKWSRGDSTMIDLCARDISKSLREEFHTDPQGRRVRTNHAAKLPIGEEQLTFWHDIRVAPRPFMERAFRQRRNQIVGDCVQLDTDMGSYNDNSSKDNPIVTLWDFTDDVLEHRQTGKLSADEIDGVNGHDGPNELRRPFSQFQRDVEPKASSPAPSLPSRRPASPAPPPPGS
jgi:hypothetical protein